MQDPTASGLDGWMRPRLPGHAPRSLWPILNGGEPAVLFCFTFRYLAVAGAGPVSLHALLFGRRRHIAKPAG